MKSVWFFILIGTFVTYHGFTTVSGEEVAQPSYSQCKPYVDAALKGEAEGAGVPVPVVDTTAAATAEALLTGSPADPTPTPTGTGSEAKSESAGDQVAPVVEETQAGDVTPAINESSDQPTTTDNSNESAGGQSDGSSEEQGQEAAAAAAGNTQSDVNEDDSKEAGEAGVEADSSEESTATEAAEAESHEGTAGETTEDSSEENTAADAPATPTATDDNDSNEAPATDASAAAPATGEAAAAAATADSSEEAGNSAEDDNSKEAQPEGTTVSDGSDGDSGEDSKEEAQPDAANRDNVADQAHESVSGESQAAAEEVQESQATVQTTTTTEAEPPVAAPTPDAAVVASAESSTQEAAPAVTEAAAAAAASAQDSAEEEDNSSEEEVESYIPRSRDNLEKILGLDGSDATQGLFNLLDKATHTTLKELKSIYETAIKPLETLYKYRDLSNRHFGDPEIFSKPMVVFMGPWSGGKSTILNWLLGIENEVSALRTGADPSPAQFNIMTHGKEDEVLDGTQLAADWTFSGLQKFGQAFLDRLRGRRLPNRLLEKVNLVEIPGILEVRKQVERSFPFNDACQWFIDRADVLFLVYDPAKLDIGPETEAILDQLKGRENQVRIVLNKADTVKPDELLRLQANLIWNISPLMASAEPPTLYVASLWGKPLNPESPTSLLVSHENNFLKDIRDATEKRVETRIASARRFAVRVRNHGKMCDCYLNTYNNHRSFFSNKKKISDDIIEHPQNYHIYEGLSTLTNISRYDLPDPDTYKDFFRLNPLWEFPTLASTCTYFRGCPINKLDIAIAYDLPELLGRFRRQRESIISAQNQPQPAPKPKPGKIKS